jgi:hypothetical protein
MAALLVRFVQGYWQVSENAKQGKIMEQLAVNYNRNYEALLSDEVVLQWLMDLETDADDDSQTEYVLQ